MRTVHRFRACALGAATLALTVLVTACAPGGSTSSPTAAPAAKPTEAAKPTAPAATTAPATAVSPAAAAKPAASPAAAAAASPAAAAGGAKPTVRIGSTNFSEQLILGELYGQALEANGYRVERRFNLGNREITFPAIDSGQIDLYAEYLATLTAFVKATPSADVPATTKALQDALKPKNLTVLDVSQAIDTNGFVVTKETADKYNLKKMSDLAPVAGQLVLGGPAECPERPFCQVGLKNTYGLSFKDFKSLDAGGPLTVAALDGKQVDVGLLFTSDAIIAQKGYVLLEDDKKLQLADNVVPIVRDALLNQAPADFKTTINAVSAKLTTAKLTDLNKQVGLDKKEPKDVAAAFLKAEGIVK